MEGQGKEQIQWTLEVNLNQASHSRQAICGECEGRGWIWVRSYEICTECGGQGAALADGGGPFSGGKPQHNF